MSVLEARRVTKRRPGVVALDDVSFELAAGEALVALVDDVVILRRTRLGRSGFAIGGSDGAGGPDGPRRAAFEDARVRRRPDRNLSQRPPAAVTTTRREERSCIG